MHELLVFVDVAVATDEPVGMVVVVMTVSVLVLVGVFDMFVSMGVLVC